MVVGQELIAFFRGAGTALQSGARSRLGGHWVAVIVVVVSALFLGLTPVLVAHQGLSAGVIVVPAVASLVALAMGRRGWLRTASLLILTVLPAAVAIWLLLYPALRSGMVVAPASGLGRLLLLGAVVLGACLLLLASRPARGVESRGFDASTARVVAACREGILLQDPTGTVLDANPAACALLGTSLEELRGQDLGALVEGRWHDDWLAAVDGASSFATSLEGTVYREDGTPVAVELAVYPMVQDGDRRVLTRLRDLTEERSAEAERRDLEIRLQRAQKMEDLGRLVGRIVHDFNNQLTVIGGHSRLMSARLPKDSPWLARLEPIQQATEHSAALIQQLLAFSRHEVLPPRIVNLNDIVGRLRNMLASLLGEDVAFQVVQGKRLGSVLADPVQMEQILLNLVVNARDAMSSGGTLRVETTEVVLERAFCEGHTGVSPGRYVMVAVTDTGCGMSRDTQKKIFEPFFTTKEKGSGLGLSTVSDIVRQSGGTVTVSSRLGQGTTFKVFLPLVESTVEDPREIRSVAAPQARGAETVLLVEDHDGVRDLVRSTLELNGYKVLEAGDGKSALAVARSYTDPIDVVLTDVVMPKMSGTELVAQLKTLRPDSATLYMTGYQDEDADVISESGDVVLAKPFTPGELLNALHQLVQPSPEVDDGCHLPDPQDWDPGHRGLGPEDLEQGGMAELAPLIRQGTDYGQDVAWAGGYSLRWPQSP